MAELETIGKYRIERVLGKGAMGVVYKAFDPAIERTVAIKTVRKELVDPDLAAQLLSRFKNEARAAGRLQHPNIVGVYEYGEEGSLAYIVMEYVEGTGLREFLNRKATFELGQIIAIMSQLLLALEFAHERGIVHRDIKPANLILTADGVLKVADFGIARIDTSNLTMTGMVMGTPSYMSPEQCRGIATDRRSDLFSAGVVLYELLTGEKPFGGAVETITYKICYEEPRPPSQIAKLELPADIDDVVALALAKDVAARFQSARAFNRALSLAYDSRLVGVETIAPTVLNLAAVKMEPPQASAWDDTVLRTIERELAQLVGPMARVMVKKAAGQTGDFGQLVALLSDNLTNPGVRKRFVDGMRNVEATGPGTGSPSKSGSSRAHLTSPSQILARSIAGPAPNPLEQAFVDATTTKLTLYLGPIARVVTRKAAQQAKNQDDFVQIIAGHLGPQDRRSFLRELGVADF